MVYANYFKRPIDILITVCIILLFSWLFLLILFLYLITTQFPVFFFQNRSGKNLQPFLLIKFRSLAEVNDSMTKRRFLLGDVLRYMSLDELPQLWNVLKGDMSLVGPRPLPIEYLPLFSEEQLIRHNVRPGITGWAQINGRHSISWQQKFERDSYYVKHLSFGQDVLILFKTIILLLSFRKDISLSEEKFKGN